MLQQLSNHLLFGYKHGINIQCYLQISRITLDSPTSILTITQQHYTILPHKLDGMLMGNCYKTEESRK